MKKVWNLLPQGLRERPFDVYTAIALIAVGIYGLIDDYFPEQTTVVISALLFHIVEIYFIAASVVILIAMGCNQKHPRFSFFGQMYGWAFIAAAGITVMTFQFWVGIFDGVSVENTGLYWLVFFVFGCIGWAAFFRSVDMYMKLLQLNKESKKWIQD